MLMLLQRLVIENHYKSIRDILTVLESNLDSSTFCIVASIITESENLSDLEVVAVEQV